MRTPSLLGCPFVLTIAMLVLPNILPAQVARPKPPDRYDVQVRYRILGDRNERVIQFEAMSANFKKAGFLETPNDDNDLAAFDPTMERMVGTVPSASVRDLLNDPRVRTILYAAAGLKLPKDDTRIRVAIELATSKDQILLFKQTLAAINRLGFKEELGYDNQRFKRIRGSLSGRHLETLLRDIRYQPSGWLAPEPFEELLEKTSEGITTPNLAAPFGTDTPIRAIEVTGSAYEPPAGLVLPPIPAEQPQQVKWTADLRRKMIEEGYADKPARLEVVLANEPTETSFTWQETITKTGATIEGRAGGVVTVTVAKAAKASDLALIADVVTVRLPRRAFVPVTEIAPKTPEPKKIEEKKLTELPLPIRTVSNVDSLPASSPDEDPLKLTRLDKLHALSRKGQKVRVVLIDSDFAGYKALFGPKSAKGAVTFIDLTAERSRDVVADAMPGDIGHGTHAALAVKLAAPDCELTLVRVAHDAPYQLVNVARAIRGDGVMPDGILARRRELIIDFANLRERCEKAKDEYRRAFDDFGDEEGPRKRRLDAQAALVKLDQEEANLLDRLDRIEVLDKGLAKLKGTNVVVCLMSWNTGFALDGLSPMSKFLDDWLIRPKTAYTRHLTRGPMPQLPLWFQPAGDTRGQSWTGVFQDVDGNSVMEFADPKSPQRPGRWSRELNFLALQSGGKDYADLPAGGKVRVSVQWREPHDPDLPEGDYRVPIANVKLQLVKQRDPKGESSASDEIDILAESEGNPERLIAEPEYGVYEHSIEVTLPADGRYALRLVCKLPDIASDPRNPLNRIILDIPDAASRLPNTTRPADAPKLSTQAIRWDLRPRLFVESADGQGRYIFGDYATETGGVAMPADSRGVYAIGSADKSRMARGFTAAGGGPQSQLLVKPDMLAPDDLGNLVEEPKARGTALSTSFAGGWAASLMSAGLLPSSFPAILKIPQGGLIEVPEAWFKK
jgi:hypothetical protein